MNPKHLKHRARMNSVILFLVLILASASMACSFAGSLFTGRAPSQPDPSSDRTPSQADQPENEPQDTAPGSGNGLIAYLGNDGNIYTIRADGDQKQAVTTDANFPSEDQTARSFYQHLTWSPSERRLAFAKIDFPDGELHASLFNAAADGSGPVEIADNGDQAPIYLYWSHDGAWLSWLSPADDRSTLALKLVPGQGGEARVLGTGQPYYWDWSPDNSSILIHTGGAASVAPSARLAFLSPDEESQELGLDLRPAFFQAPDWSPSGEAMLFVAETEGGDGALVIADERGEIQQEIFPGRGPMAFGWSPDGSKIAVLTPTGDGPAMLRQLSWLDPRPPHDRRVIAEDGVLAFFWSPDGQKLVFFTPSFLPADPGEPITIHSGRTRRTSAPLPGAPLQDEGQFVLTVHVIDVDGGQVLQTANFPPTIEFLNVLPFFDQYARSAQIWSPDSRHLVFAVDDQEGQPGIYVLPIEGSAKMKRIADGSLAFWSWK